MKIDKSKLMKNAWETAKNGFYTAALNSVIGKARFTKKSITDICRYNLMNKKQFFELAHVQREMNIDFTVRDFFPESLRMSWVEAKKSEKRDFEKTLDAIENEHAEKKKIEKQENVARANADAPRRELVVADKYSTGQKLHGFVITGLGQEFRPNCDMFSLGISPDTDYVQYAYFN